MYPFYRCAAQGASKAEPTVLALGVDGGFRTDEQKYDVVKTHRLVVFKAGSTEGFSVSFPEEVGTVVGVGVQPSRHQSIPSLL